MAKRVADLLVDVLVDAAIKRVYCVSVDSLEGITDSGSAARMEGASEAGFCSYYATDYFGGTSALTRRIPRTLEPSSGITGPAPPIRTTELPSTDKCPLVDLTARRFWSLKNTVVNRVHYRQLSMSRPWPAQDNDG